MATAISPSVSSPVPSSVHSANVTNTASDSAKAGNIHHTPYQLTSNNMDKDAVTRQQTFQFGGKNSVTVDQSMNSYEKISERVSKNNELVADYGKKIKEKEADLAKHKDTHRASYIFDPLSVSSWTRTLKREKAGMEAELSELHTKKAAAEKQLLRDNQMLDSISGSLQKGLGSNIISEEQRLNLKGSDNIVANTRFGGYLGSPGSRFSF